MALQTIELQQLPPALPTFFNAALTAARRPPARVELVPQQVHIAALGVDRGRLSAYNALLGFKDGEHLPLSYPHVLGSSLHMHLMTQPAFPLPMLGLVHVRNEIEQRRPIGVAEVLDLRVSLVESREVAQGLEFDLLTEFADAQASPVWRGVSTYLHRVPGRKPQRKPPEEEGIALAQYLRLDAPADIGRRYAKVSRDYNPIHLYAVTARLFGFKRAIATGMWSAARVLALLTPQLAAPASAFSFRFRQPLLLPGRAVLRFGEGEGGVRFALVGADSGRVHLGGTLR